MRGRFFARLTEDTAARMVWYRGAAAQAERTLGGLRAGPGAIGAALAGQHAGALALAGRAAAADAQLQRVKQLYAQLWRAKTGSARDPFEDRAEGDRGLEGL
jgi:nucleoporin p58/p45